MDFCANGIDGVSNCILLQLDYDEANPSAGNRKMSGMPALRGSRVFSSSREGAVRTLDIAYAEHLACGFDLYGYGLETRNDTGESASNPDLARLQRELQTIIQNPPVPMSSELKNLSFEIYSLGYSRWIAGSRPSKRWDTRPSSTRPVRGRA